MTNAKYFELVENSFTGARSILQLNNNNVRELAKRRDTPAWTSIFMFDGEDLLSHIENLKSVGESPSVREFRGKVSANYLWIDIDVKDMDDRDVRENIKITINETKKIINRLNLVYDLEDTSFKVYFSGMKGFHIGIPSKCFGGDVMNGEAVPSIFKLMAKEITEQSKLVDFKIFNTTRIFRLPNSKHNKTEYYKIQVSPDTIRRLDVDYILDMAESCMHEGVDFKVSISIKLTELFEKCCGKVGNQFDLLEGTESKNNNTNNNKTLFRFPKKGERNDALFRMAVKLFGVQQRDLSNDMVIDLMNMISDAVNSVALIKGYDQISEFERRTLINQAFKYTRLKNTTDALTIKKVTDYAMQVFDYAMNSKYVPSLIEEVDLDLGGGLICGNMYPLIGRGGTMKSIVLQNIFFNEAINDRDSLYFNQEMSINEYFKRQCLIALEIDFIRQVKDGHIDKTQVADIIKQMEEMTKHRCHISNATDLSPDDIKAAIKQTEDRVGRKVFAVGVDSLSGMKMVGRDEVATVVHNTKYLKEVAKETQTVIMPVAHTRNDCPRTARDTSIYTRAGSKTIDNCDGYFCLSVIVDRENSYFDTSPPDIRYMPGYVYIRFVNKRESGNTIDKVCQVNDSLRLFTIEEDPQSFN